MAEPGSASCDANVPASSSSAAALPEWEMLSMSMSASALGKPDADNPQPENPNLDLPAFEQENPNPDAWSGSVHRDGSGDIVAEPFTEGWKPHLSTSSDLYGYGTERGDGEQSRREEALLFSQGIETYYDSNASMVVPEGSFVSEKGDAGVLSYAHSDDVELDHVSPKTRCKGGKRPRKSSRVLWSIAVAATMVGVFVLGHRWRLACRDNQQLRLELSAKDEKLNDLLYQVSRLKDIVGGYQRVPVTRSSSL